MSRAEAWLRVPLAEYEAHMEEIGQAAALRKTFRRAYSELHPRRLLILGCTTGRDFELVDPGITTICVGVDLNREYLDAARERLHVLRGTLQLVQGDVLEVLSGCMSLRRAEEMRRCAIRSGLAVVEQRDVALPHGKSFSAARFENAPEA